MFCFFIDKLTLFINMNSLYFENCSFCKKKNISFPLHIYGDCNICVHCGLNWINSDYCCKRCGYYPDNIDSIKRLTLQIAQMMFLTDGCNPDNGCEFKRQEDLLDKIFDCKPIITKTKIYNDDVDDYDGSIENYPVFLDSIINLYGVKLEDFDYKEHCKYVFPYLQSLESDGEFYFPRGNNVYFLITSDSFHLECENAFVYDKMEVLKSEGSFDYYRLLYSDLFCNILHDIQGRKKDIEDVTPKMLEDKLEDMKKEEYKDYEFCQNEKEQKIIHNLIRKKPCYLKCDIGFNIKNFKDNDYNKEIFTLLLVNNRLSTKLPLEMLFTIFELLTNIANCWCYIFKN